MSWCCRDTTNVTSVTERDTGRATVLTTDSSGARIGATIAGATDARAHPLLAGKQQAIDHKADA